MQRAAVVEISLYAQSVVRTVVTTCQCAALLLRCCSAILLNLRFCCHAVSRQINNDNYNEHRRIGL